MLDTELTIDDRTAAILIDSKILDAPVWFAFKDGWKSGDDIPVFYASELPMLRKKSPRQLEAIYRVKSTFGGGMVRK